MSGVSLAYLTNPAVLSMVTDPSQVKQWILLIDEFESVSARIGARSFERLYELASGPDVPPDVWQLLSQLASRGYGQSTPSEAADASLSGMLCGEHRAAAPVLSSTLPFDLLVSDLMCMPWHSGAIIAAMSQGHVADVLERSRCERCGIYAEPLLGSAHENFWRREFLRCGLGFDSIGALSREMFPSVMFAPGWMGDVASIEGDAHANVELLITHLSVLNDFGPAYMGFTQPEMRIQQFASVGIEVSPESPRVHQQASAMARRTFDFEFRSAADDSVSVRARRCEWHTKMHPTSGRIYFCTEVDLVLVGKVCSHL